MKTLLEMARKLCADAGFDPEVVTESHLQAALRRRQQRVGAASPATYAERLRDEAAEQQEVLEELLVRETWFYRDQAPFELLTDLAGSRWQRGEQPVRALSAPCASGEEPYSIAIALAMGGVAPARITVDAFDLSRRSLAAATAAVYSERSLGKLPAPLRERWLQRTAGGEWRVADGLRQAVTLHFGNLLALPASLAGASYDIVFCRNALIYLNPAARAAVLDQLTARLAPGGVLVVGHAETGLLQGRPFRPMGKPGTFAFERAAQGRTVAGPTPRSIPPPTAARAPQRRSIPAAPTEKARAAPTSSVAQLKEALALADRGSYAEAAAQVDALLGQQPDNADAQHLLGLIRAAEGNTAAARQCFQRALYLAPAHLPSLQHLALLAERCGDAAQARLLQQRAARLESGA